MSFFARGAYHRQMGDRGFFSSATQSPEAWIWYGHCAGQNARRDLRQAFRRAHDSQIVRDRNHDRRSMDEKLPAKTSPAPTTHAPPK
jgi:hypothetical protein